MPSSASERAAMSSRRRWASASCTTAAAFPFTVSTTGRRLFLSCFISCLIAGEWSSTTGYFSRCQLTTPLQQTQRVHVDHHGGGGPAAALGRTAHGLERLHERRAAGGLDEQLGGVLALEPRHRGLGRAQHLY